MLRDPAKEIGRKIENARERERLTQAELAALTGLNRQYVGELEAGKTTKHLDSLVAVLDALGLELVAVPRTSLLAVGSDDSQDESDD